MTLKAEWQTIDHGTHSEYIIAAEGTPGYGVVGTDGEWMVFTTFEEAEEYFLFLD